MRITTNSKEAPYTDVYINGAVLERCVAADDEEGWADILVMEHGRYTGDATRVYGTVQFDINEPAPRELEKNGRTYRVVAIDDTEDVAEDLLYWWKAQPYMLVPLYTDTELADSIHREATATGLLQQLLRNSTVYAYAIDIEGWDFDVVDWAERARKACGLIN